MDEKDILLMVAQLEAIHVANANGNALARVMESVQNNMKEEEVKDVGLISDMVGDIDLVINLVSDTENLGTVVKDVEARVAGRRVSLPQL